MPQSVRLMPKAAEKAAKRHEPSTKASSALPSFVFADLLRSVRPPETAKNAAALGRDKFARIVPSFQHSAIPNTPTFAPPVNLLDRNGAVGAFGANERAAEHMKVQRSIQPPKSNIVQESRFTAGSETSRPSGRIAASHRETEIVPSSRGNEYVLLPAHSWAAQKLSSSMNLPHSAAALEFNELSDWRSMLSPFHGTAKTTGSDLEASSTPKANPDIADRASHTPMAPAAASLQRAHAEISLNSDRNTGSDLARMGIAGEAGAGLGISAERSEIGIHASLSTQLGGHLEFAVPLQRHVKGSMPVAVDVSGPSQSLLPKDWEGAHPVAHAARVTKNASRPQTRIAAPIQMMLPWLNHEAKAIYQNNQPRKEPFSSGNISRHLDSARQSKHGTNEKSRDRNVRCESATPESRQNMDASQRVISKADHTAAAAFEKLQSAVQREIQMPELLASQSHAVASRIAYLSNLNNLAEKIRACAQLRQGHDAMLEIQLTPPRLGSVLLRVETEGREMRVHFVAQSEGALQLLRDMRTDLSGAVSEQGFDLKHFDVDHQPMQDQRPQTESAGWMDRQQTTSKRTVLHGSAGAGPEGMTVDESAPSLDFGYNTLDLVA